MKSSLQSFTAVILCIYYSVTSGYELILRQKDVGIATFSSSVRSTFLENENDPNANTFTNIGNLKRTNYIDANGYYTFKLIYIIDAEAYTLEWKQRSWLIATVITGYSPIDIPIQHHAIDTSDFEGLGLSSRDSSFLDGDAHKHGNWWNSVGTISTHNGGIPAFDQQIAVSAALYVYNPNYELILRQKDVRSNTFSHAVKSTHRENDNNANANTFTNIGNIYPPNYICNRKFRFKLIYYNLHPYAEANKVDNVESVTLEWTQSSWLIYPIITGYNVINVPTQHHADDSSNFEGLCESSDDAYGSFLDSDAVHINWWNADNHINWWNSVGTITRKYGGIPAFDKNVAMSAELYVYKEKPCAHGYFEQIGDIGGSGSINGVGGGEMVSTCQSCADLCSTVGLCNSYECSGTELKCNLNTESNPTAETYKDYAFCTKLHTECKLEILSVDHGSGTSGKYFNFDINEVDIILRRTDWHGLSFTIYNENENEMSEVILWRASNGGSLGSGHGRKNDGTAQEGDFHVGDVIAFVGIDGFCQPSKRCPMEVLSVDHESGTVGRYFNFDLDLADTILGRTDWSGENFNIYNSRTAVITKVKVWRASNGGSVGGGHGRKDDGTAEEGDFSVGDEISFVGIDSCQPSTGCPMDVLSVDHESGSVGAYFNFDLDLVDTILGRTDWSGENFIIYNSRTTVITKVKLWRASNGGSIGSGHGRKDDGTAEEGDFSVGDDISFVGIDSFCQPSTRCPMEVLSVDHGSGTVGRYFNFDLDLADAILGRTDWSGENFIIYNSRTVVITKVKLWRASNGGSVGSGHGRKDDGTAEEGDFSVGDEITIVDAETQYIECFLSFSDNTDGNNNDLFCGTNDDKPLWAALISLNQDLLNSLIELKGDESLQGIFEYIQCSEFVYYAVTKASVPGPVQMIEFTNIILGLLHDIPGIGDIIGDSADAISQFIVNLLDELTPDDIGLQWNDYYERNGKIFNPFEVLEPLAQMLSVEICDTLVTGESLNTMLESLRDSESITALIQSFNDNIYGFLTDNSNNLFDDSLKSELLNNDFYKEFTFVMTIGMQICFSKGMSGCITRMHGIATNLKGESKIMDSRSMYVEFPTFEYGVSSSGFIHFDFMSNLQSLTEIEVSLSVGVSAQTPGSGTVSNYKDQWETYSDRSTLIPFISDGPTITVDFINGNIEDNSLLVDIMTGGSKGCLLILYAMNNNMNCNGFRIDLSVGDYDAFGGSILFGYEYRKEGTGSVKQNLKWIDDVQLPNYQDIANMMMSLSSDTINIFPDAMDSVTDFVGNLGDQILEQSINSVKDVLNGVIGVVEDIANVGVDVANVGVDGVNVAINGVNEVVDDVVGAAEDVFNGVIDVANDVIAGANSVANTANDVIDSITSKYNTVSDVVNTAVNGCKAIDQCIDFDACVPMWPNDICVGVSKCISDIININDICDGIFFPITEADNVLKSAIDDLPDIPTIPTIDSVDIDAVPDIPNIPNIDSIEIANIEAKKDNVNIDDLDGEFKTVFKNNAIRLPNVYIKPPLIFYVICIFQAFVFVLIGVLVGILIERYCLGYREYKIVKYMDTDTEPENK